MSRASANIIKLIFFAFCVSLHCEFTVKIIAKREGPHIIHYAEIAKIFPSCDHRHIHLHLREKSIPIYISSRGEQLRNGDKIYFYSFQRGEQVFLLTVNEQLSPRRWKEWMPSAKSGSPSSHFLQQRHWEQDNILATFSQENLRIEPLRFDYKMWTKASRKGVLQIKFNLENVVENTAATLDIKVLHSQTRKFIGKTKVFVNEDFCGMYQLSNLKKVKTTQIRRGENTLRLELQPGAYLPLYLNALTVKYQGLVSGRGCIIAKNKHGYVATNDVYFFLDEKYNFSRSRGVFVGGKSRLFFWREQNCFSGKVIIGQKLTNRKISANYLIIAPGHLQNELKPLLEWRQRQGLHCEFVAVERIYNSFDYGAKSAQSLQKFLRYAASNNEKQLEYVVLIGDVPTKSNVGIPTNYVYTFFDGVTASDYPYSLQGKIAVGRIPTQNKKELKSVINKIIAYETRGGIWQRKIDFVAGQGGFGETIDDFCEVIFKKLISRYLPNGYELGMLYANPNSPYFVDPKDFPRRIVQQIGLSSLFFVYIGHGNYNGFADISYKKRKYPMFGHRNIRELQASNVAPIFVSIACSNSYFDHQRQSFGEGLLLHPYGATAFIGSTRISHPYANALVGKGMLKGLFVENCKTIGQLLNYVNRELLFPPTFDFLQILIDGGAKMFTIGTPLRDLERIRKEHCYLYNILGDPATRINYPQNLLSINLEKEYDNFLKLRMTSSVNIPKNTTVYMSLERDLLDTNTRDRVTKSDRAIVRASRIYADGIFQIPISDLKPGKYYIKMCLEIKSKCFIGTYLYSKGKTNGN